MDSSERRPATVVSGVRQKACVHRMIDRAADEGGSGEGDTDLFSKMLGFAQGAPVRLKAVGEDKDNYNGRMLSVEC